MTAHALFWDGLLYFASQPEVLLLKDLCSASPNPLSQFTKTCSALFSRKPVIWPLVPAPPKATWLPKAMVSRFKLRPQFISVGSSCFEGKPSPQKVESAGQVSESTPKRTPSQQSRGKRGTGGVGDLISSAGLVDEVQNVPSHSRRLDVWQSRREVPKDLL